MYICLMILREVKYNQEFNTIDNPDKAYVLGLWFADGGIFENSIQITLHEQDLGLINQIQEKFPFFNIHTNGNAKVLRKQNPELANHFIKQGALSRKSYENKNNIRLPNLSKELMSHFIRGFFDGDGSVYIQKINNIKVEIGCAGFYFIAQMLKEFYDNGINMFMQCKFPNDSNCRKQDYYVIYTSSFTESKKFSNYIYDNDSTLFMKRKRDKLEVELIPRNSKDRLVCGNCNSTNTTYIGFRNNKTRIYCKDCNIRSTQTAPYSSNIISGGDELLEG